jgi:hypothetical protein
MKDTTVKPFSNGFPKVRPFMSTLRKIALHLTQCQGNVGKSLFPVILVLAPWPLFTSTTSFAQDAPQANTEKESNPEEPNPPISDAEIADMVRKLGSNIFQERETATRNLQKAGEAALPLLREAAKAKDREVRVRAEQLITAIEDKIKKTVTLKFLRDTSPDLDYGMTGWKFSAKILGTSRKARELFLEMYQADPKLLALLEQSPEKAEPEVLNFAGRLAANIVNGGDLTIGESALLLLTMYLPKMLENTTMQDVVQAATFSGAFKRSIILETGDTPARKIFGHWIANVNEKNSSRAMLTARKTMIPESAQLARRLLQKELDDGDSMVALSLLLLFGDRQDVALLEKLLEDETEIERFDLPVGYQLGKPNFPGEVQPAPPIQLQIPIRPGQPEPAPEKIEGDAPAAPKTEQYVAQKSDLALAVLLHLSGQDLKKHFPLMPNTRRRVLTATDVAFPVSKPELRVNAYKAWESSKTKFLEGK